MGFFSSYVYFVQSQTLPGDLKMHVFSVAARQYLSKYEQVTLKEAYVFLYFNSSFSENRQFQYWLSNRELGSDHLWVHSPVINDNYSKLVIYIKLNFIIYSCDIYSPMVTTKNPQNITSPMVGNLPGSSDNRRAGCFFFSFFLFFSQVRSNVSTSFTPFCSWAT